MTPNDDDNTQLNQTPIRRDQAVVPIPRETSDAQQKAAADITRSQIHQIYERESPSTHLETERSIASSPYERTHTRTAALSPAEHLQQYHTAWQDYYQKYYERYYTQAVRHTAEQLRLKAEMEQKGTPSPIFGTSATPPAEDTPRSATKKLQAEFKDKVRRRAKKVRHSRHFWPLVTALTVAGVFLFLQYNSLLIGTVAAYVSPGSVDPQNIIVDPSADTKVGPDPKLIIPKINVDAPVDYSVTTFDNDLIEQHLKNGVVKYAIPGANAFPGQVGNLVIGGHSSNDVFDDGGYKFVFAQLEKMAIGDTFYLNYQGTRYTYQITKTQTIEPNQISILTQPVSKPTVTLVTCTPVGTALHRFLVIGEQISPDPSGAEAAPNDAGAQGATTIPGNSPTILQRILGQ